MDRDRDLVEAAQRGEQAAFVDLVCSTPEGGVRYFQGRDYGDPIIWASLWRVDNVLLYGVDFHVYDLPGALRSMVADMDARARSLAGHR